MSPVDLTWRIADAGVVPVLVLDSVTIAVPVAEALLEGGVDVAEVTFRTSAAADAIASIRSAMPSMLVGAGTLLTPEDVVRANEAGAEFGVAPGLSERTVATARAVGLPFFPGVCTPGDVERALELSLTELKFFPAAAFGGPTTLTALLGAYRHTGVRFIPTGGVTIDTAAQYWSITEVLAVGATALAPADLQRAGDWSQIRARAAAFRAAFRQARPVVRTASPSEERTQP